MIKANNAAALPEISPPAKRKRLSFHAKEAMEFYFFISPWFLVFITLGLIPLLYGLYLSFTNYTGFNMLNLRFVGFRNYLRVLTDNDAMYALGRTFLITLINVPIGTALGFFMAILLNNNIKAVGVFRTIFYLPSIIPVVATGMMWKALLAKENGLINNMLLSFGLQPLDWLGYDHATQSLLLLLMWGSGGGLIIYLAGLKGVPRSLYEAASIDGASALHRFRNITIPLMTPVLFFNVIMGIIGSLQIFAQPILLTAGSGSGLLAMPIRPNYMYLVHAFQQIFAFNRYGYGLALLWILFVLILLLTIVVFTTSRYWVYYEIDQEGR